MSSNTKRGIGMGLFIGTMMLIGSLMAGDPPNFDLQEVVGYTSMALSTAFVVLGIKAVRDDAVGGITFGTGFKTGIVIALIAGLVAGLYTVFHLGVIDTEYMEKFVAFEQQQIMASGGTDSEIATGLATLEEQKEMFSSVWFQGFFITAMVSVIGGLAAVIASLVFKKKEA